MPGRATLVSSAVANDERWHTWCPAKGEEPPLEPSLDKDRLWLSMGGSGCRYGLPSVHSQSDQLSR